MASSDEGFTKLQAGFEADVYNVCTRDVPRMAENGLLIQLDTSRIEAWATLFPALMGEAMLMACTTWYPMWRVRMGGVEPSRGTRGLTSTGSCLRMSLSGNGRYGWTTYYALAIAGLALGFEDPYAMTDEQLGQVEEYFLAHIDQFRTFYETDAEFHQLYKSGEIIRCRRLP